MARVPVTTLSFTAADGTNLETVNSSFVQIQFGQGLGYLTVLSNTLRQAFGDGNRFIYRDGTPTYTSDQYALAAISGLTNNNGNIGVVCRCNSDTNANADFYAVFINSGTSPKETNLVRINNGTLTSLDLRTSITWVNDDTIELEAITNGANCDLKVYKNGALQYTIVDTSPLSSGKPGIYFQNGSANQVFMDNWVGGDLTTTFDYTLPCDQGSYTLTGQAATLTFSGGGLSYTLVCEYGTYTITGSDTYSATSVSLDGGTYTISGQDVTFIFSQGAQVYNLLCEFGIYEVTGRSAGLVWSGAPPSGGGDNKLSIGLRLGL